MTDADTSRSLRFIPWMIALPLWVTKLYHNFNGAVMPYELLAALEQHLSSPATALDNGDE